MKIVSGLFKGRILTAPRGDVTRPTSGRLREALFNICRNEVEGADFLDLFAGSGAMGLEALSRGAHAATFVDNSKGSLKCIQKNIQALGIEKHCHRLCGDVFEVLMRLSKLHRSYNIIYADPPYYRKGQKVAQSLKLLQFIDSLLENGHAILAPNGSLFIEEDAKADDIHNAVCRHLVLQDARATGRSALLHWIRRT